MHQHQRVGVEFTLVAAGVQGGQHLLRQGIALVVGATVKPDEQYVHRATGSAELRLRGSVPLGPSRTSKSSAIR
jgi:hypothetical protein